jgi:hypothetical protein
LLKPFTLPGITIIADEVGPSKRAIRFGMAQNSGALVFDDPAWTASRNHQVQQDSGLASLPSN